ncbi:unnamed protein product [Spodoptera exigua]|nr:unnamed protein product [Spodoptera exigua]
MYDKRRIRRATLRVYVNAASGKTRMRKVAFVQQWTSLMMIILLIGAFIIIFISLITSSAEHRSPELPTTELNVQLFSSKHCQLECSDSLPPSTYRFSIFNLINFNVIRLQLIQLTPTCTAVSKYTQDAGASTHSTDNRSVPFPYDMITVTLASVNIPETLQKRETQQHPEYNVILYKQAAVCLQRIPFFVRGKSSNQCQTRTD